jgi:uncharacterized protein involved in exopolysaccharide biosynthesis
MSRAGIKSSHAPPPPEIFAPPEHEDQDLEAAREREAELLRLLWDRRRSLFRCAAIGLLASTLVAFLIPKSYTSTTQLMPPDTQSASGMAMMAGMAAKAGAGLSGMAGDLLGLKSSGALFIGVLRSRTSQDHLIEQFELRKAYGRRLVTDARTELDERTAIAEDRKSGIITVSVTDHSPQRAAAMANAYVDELNSLVAELSTSAAHRERVFLEERLIVAKQDLDDASNAVAQFSSKNNTLDIQTEGKAMLDAAAALAGQLVAAEAQLEGLRQIYTDNNPRVRALNARAAELRKQLEKFGGTESDSNTRGSEAAGQSAGPPSSEAAVMPFPTIRNLPLLGARYADYYRRAKIQETVYELLTEQYELAKVEEAKETPSVKILDPATVPERRSSPPRLLIMFSGTFFALAASVAWVWASKKWESAAPGDPRRILAQEVISALKVSVPWSSHNGDAPGSAAQKIWSRFSRLRTPTNGSTDQ